MTAGGKTRWSATARVIFEARQSVSVETLTPLADDLARRIQASANGIVGKSFAGQQHDLGPDHVSIGGLIFARPSDQLRTLASCELDEKRTLPRHVCSSCRGLPSQIRMVTVHKIRHRIYGIEY
jgi:hypothetical protein